MGCIGQLLIQSGQQIGIGGSDIAFIDHFIRNGVDGIAAFINDAVYSDHVLVTEGLPQIGHGIKEQGTFIEGIYSQMRHGGSVGRLAQEGDLLIDESGQS